MPYRDMPEPLPLSKVLGPSVILAGLGVGSGEYIIWPFMASTVGLGFLWAAIVSVTIQYFLNMEIERYTLATGETAVAGFVRFWKPWGVLFCVFTILPNMWPGWATSGVTILTFLLGGGNVTYITIGILIAAGVALTASPVVYQTLERAQFFKVALTLVFLAVAIVAAIGPSAWGGLSAIVTEFGQLPDRNVVPISLILSGLVFAGAGRREQPGAEQLDPRQGIRHGRLHPAHRVAHHRRRGRGAGDRFDGASGRRRTSGASTAGGRSRTKSSSCRSGSSASSRSPCSRRWPTRPCSGLGLGASANLAFVRAEGEALKTVVAPWFGTFYWVFGALSLILVSLGVIDYISRLVADVIKTVYLPKSQRWSESRVYFLVAWSTIAAGSVILLSGVNQPLLLLTIAACLNGMVMFVYSILLIQLNRRGLPPAIRVDGPATRDAGGRDACSTGSFQAGW